MKAPGEITEVPNIGSPETLAVDIKVEMDKKGLSDCRKKKKKGGRRGGFLISAGAENTAASAALILYCFGKLYGKKTLLLNIKPGQY